MIKKLIIVRPKRLPVPDYMPVKNYLSIIDVAEEYRDL
jgi:hypothetical protein